MLQYSKYIIMNLGGATLFIASSLTCVIWLTQSLRFVDLIVNRGLDMLAFLYLTTMLLPSLLGFLLPIAIAISALYAYHKLIADSELVILKSAGLSRWQLARPALLFSVLLVAVGYLISLYLLPLTYRQYKDMQAFARDNYASLLLQEGVFNTPVDGLTVFIRERYSDGTLKGILVHDNRDPKQPTTMMAEEGRLIKTAQGPRFVLVNGNRQEIDHEAERLSYLAFDDYILDISLFAGERGARAREAKERYLGELLNPEAGITDIQRAEFLAEAHQRITWPLYNLAMPLFVLAVLLGGQFNRRGNWRRYTVTLVSVSFIIAGAVGISNMMVKYPNLLFLMYAFPLGIGLGSLYYVVRSPLEKAVPGEPPAGFVQQEGA